MIAYVDSGVLAKLYIREPNSVAAAQAIERSPSLRFNALQDLEIRNTFPALEGRGVITAAQREAAEHSLETDIQTRRLRRTVPDWPQVYRSAIRLSRDHTAETLARSLDILHVAIALTGRSDLLLTADSRQESVARRAGLRTQLIL